VSQPVQPNPPYIDQITIETDDGFQQFVGTYTEAEADAQVLAYCGATAARVTYRQIGEVLADVAGGKVKKQANGKVK
jgi:hypothetical protein